MKTEEIDKLIASGQWTKLFEDLPSGWTYSLNVESGSTLFTAKYRVGDKIITMRIEHKLSTDKIEHSLSLNGRAYVQPDTIIRLANMQELGTKVIEAVTK